MAGTIFAARPVAEGIYQRHARNLSARRAGFSALKNDAAPLRSWPDYNPDESGQAALSQNGPGLDAVCPAAGGHFHPHALSHVRRFSICPGLKPVTAIAGDGRATH